MTRAKKILVGVGILFFVVCMVAYTASPKSEGSAKETPVPTIRAAAPANTPSSTPATATSVRTTVAVEATLVPTPTVQVVVKTPEQKAYVDHVIATMQTLGASTSRFSALLDAAAQNSAMVQDASWKAKLGAELTLWRQTYEEAKSTTPPPGLEIVNGKWVEVLGHLNLAADNINKGIEQSDNDLIEQAVAELKIVTQGTFDTGTLINQFNLQFQKP